MVVMEGIKTEYILPGLMEETEDFAAEVKIEPFDTEEIELDNMLMDVNDIKTEENSSYEIVVEDGILDFKDEACSAEKKIPESEPTEHHVLDKAEDRSQSNLSSKQAVVIVNQDQLNMLVFDEPSAIAFLQTHRILHPERKCINNHDMKLRELNKNPKWKCNKTICDTSYGVRKGTWLESSKLKFVIIIRFIYAWANEYSSTKYCKHEFGMGQTAIAKWKNYLREVTADALLKSQGKIGGPGLTVEIDELCFAKSKSYVGRICHEQWVFLGICRETNECFIRAVEDRTAKKLLAVIKDSISPGTTIVSDLWKSYKGITNIPDMNFTQLTVNHSKHFVDPVTSSYSQSIESLWASAKMRNKKERGTSRNRIDSYLCEFMWRYKHRNNNLFVQILKDIANFHKLK